MDKYVPEQPGKMAELIAAEASPESIEALQEFIKTKEHKSVVKWLSLITPHGFDIHDIKQKGVSDLTELYSYIRKSKSNTLVSWLRIIKEFNAKVQTPQHSQKKYLAERNKNTQS